MSAKKAETGGAKKSLWLYCGADDLSARRAAERKVLELCPEAEQDFGLETVTPGGEEKTTDAVCELLNRTLTALLTPPLFGGGKTVFLDGAPAGFFDPTKDPGRFAGVKEAVEKLLEVATERLPEGMNLVILTGKLNKAQTFYKRFEKFGHAEDFEGAEGKGAAKEFPNKIQAVLDRLGMEMDKRTLQMLAERTGHNLRQAENELEKLSLYLGERKRATAEDVEAMVASVKTGKYWEFADTYCGCDLGKTLATYRAMLKQGENPVGLLSMLEGSLREMAVLSDCLKRGWLKAGGYGSAQWTLPPEGEKVLEGMKLPAGWLLGRRAEMAGAHSAAWWFRCLELAIRTHESITGGNRLNPDAAVELFIERTLGRGGRG